MIRQGALTGAANRRTARLLWDRDGGLCWRCRRPIDPTVSALLPGGLTIGHVVPRSRGGSDGLDNLAPEHRRCNLAAGDREPRPQPVIVTP